MARTKQGEPAAFVFTTHPLARVAGRDAPLHTLLPIAAVRLHTRGITLRAAGVDPLDDYAQIDPTLDQMAAEDLSKLHFDRSAWPADGLGYGGFGPEARSRFLLWLDAPEHEAPSSFHTLYLAHVESALIAAIAADDRALLEQAVAALRALEPWPQWAQSEQRARTLLLAYLLLGDGVRLRDWLVEGQVPPAVAGVALGWQAHLNVPITPAEVLAVARRWGIIDDALDEGVVTLRLRTLTESLGVDPLTAALRAVAPAPAPVRPSVPVAEAGESAEVDADQSADQATDARAAPEATTWPGEPRGWRCAHRDLRLAFAQPDVEPWLAPVLAELLDDVPLAGAPAAVATEEVSESEAGGWTLILEFGHSRSEYFEFALKQAQRLPGYSALLNEQRHVVHRVHFKKSEMRRFWQLWEYAMNWAETHVYLNGKELEKWKIYPYSQYLT
jgi:hypothetical protein